MWNAGLPNGRESYGNGVLIVVRVMENMIQGEGEQVILSCKKNNIIYLKEAITPLRWGGLP